MDLQACLAGAMAQTSCVAVQAIHRDGTVHIWNDASVNLYGIAQDQALGRHICELLAFHGPAKKFNTALMALWDYGKSDIPREHKIKNLAGASSWVYSTMFPVLEHGTTKLVLLMALDISSQKRKEQALYERVKRVRQFFENSADAIILLRDGKFNEFNPAALRLFGYARYQALKGAVPYKISPLYQPDGMLSQKKMEIMHAIVRAKGSHRFEWQYATGDHGTFWAEVTVTALHEDNDGSMYAIVRDITDRKKAEEHIRHLSEHDFLTGLPNRVLLQDRLHQGIAAAKRNSSVLAVLFLDLDHFKNINDSLGHHIGDKLLQAVAERLKKCVRSNDTVSRQGGDEFVVMLTEIGGVDQVAHIADTILQATSALYHIEEHALLITTCVGISMYPDDGQDAEVLLKHADAAMYHAKEQGRNNYQFFNHEMTVRSEARVTLEHQLCTALEQEQFFLEYQPKIDIISGRIVGAEALLRWQHPEMGVITPAYFLSTAEASGLIVPIGDWVLQAACRQAKAWQDLGTPMVVGINLSPIQFRQNNFLHKLREVLRQTNLAPGYLELEITERILIGTAGVAIETMHALRKMGVALALDDFGTGYSSLSYLKNFPVDTLKIDQSFVRDLNDEANDAAIIRAILIMAKSLNLKVIAEGVESASQFDFLRAQGCDECQGNYFSRPALAADLSQFLQTHYFSSNPLFCASGTSKARG